MQTAVVGACRFDRYVPPVQPFTDSIWYGVGCAHIAGPREPIYYAAQAAGNPLLFVGSQSFAGADNGLAVDSNCECVPGIDCTTLNGLLFRMTTYKPRVPLYACGINDVIAGADAPTIVGRIQSGLTTMWSLRWFGNTQIVLSPILRTLNPTNNAVVQAANALIPAMVAGLSFASHVTYIPQLYDCVSTANYSDNVHPNDAGATQLGNAAWSLGLSAAVASSRGAT